jgi:hypothetical protein
MFSLAITEVKHADICNRASGLLSGWDFMIPLIAFTFASGFAS